MNPGGLDGQRVSNPPPWTGLGDPGPLGLC